MRVPVCANCRAGWHSTCSPAKCACSKCRPKKVAV